LCSTDEILIFDINTLEAFEASLKIFIKQLKERKLTFKEKNKFIIKFKPRVLFDLLKFHFIYTNYKKNLNKDNFT